MAYNFNPRQRQKRKMKFDEYQRLSMINWSMVPIGQIDINKKYTTICAPTYRSFNECLINTLYDRDLCQPKQEQIIKCQKTNDLYQTQEKLKILRSFKKRKFKKSQEQNNDQN